MTRVLVTGMSGVGKSTVIAALGERGHRAVDTDSDTWSRWETPSRRLARLGVARGRDRAAAGEDDARPLFLAGCKSNQGRFYPQLTAVVLLTAPLETLLDRIAHRDTNPYGKSDEERASSSTTSPRSSRSSAGRRPTWSTRRLRCRRSSSSSRRSPRRPARGALVWLTDGDSDRGRHAAPVYLSAVARPRYPKKGEPLPPPLPPASRTVGQVVAEAIALYRSNFAWALALGLPVALADQVLSTGSIVARIALLAAASPAFSLAYAGACAIRQDEVPPLRTWVVAVAVGVVTFLPAAFFFGWFLIVAILWLGLAGHAVPAVMAERLGVLGALRRTFQLGRADYVHAAGSFAALAILFGLTRSALGLLLRSQADATVRTAIFLADVVLSPLLFLGAAIVYVDLVARVGLTREDRRRLRQAALGRPE